MIDGLQPISSVERICIPWLPPTPEFLKINVDASFVEAISAASVGVVVRNHSREVLISSWDYIGTCLSVEEAELRATISGLYIGITLHKPIFLETDCSFVTLVFANDNLDTSNLADLKKEALSVSKMMSILKITKINRMANMVAHEIAKFSFINRSNDILINSVPPNVPIAVMNDCMNICFN